MVELTSEHLRQIAPHLPAVNREALLPYLKAALIEGKINTYLRVAAFLGQTLEESREFTKWEENLSYSAQRLCQVWPKRFPTIDAASPFAHNPQALAEKVYGGRMGNIHPGDGWKYRGRGPEQTTGYTEYSEAQDLTGIELLSSPDLLSKPEFGFRVAAIRWFSHGLNQLADNRKFKEITLKINGGLNGYAERLTFYSRALRVLPQDLFLGETSKEEKSSDNTVADIHEKEVVPTDVMLPTSTGVKVPAVINDPDKEQLTPNDLQNVVTGHSDSLKAIATRASIKIGSMLAIVWGAGMAGKILLVVSAIIILGAVGYEVSKYWPRVRSFALKIIKK